MNTDMNESKRSFYIAAIGSLDSDPEQGQAKPESGLQNLCSSVSICGSLLHGDSSASLQSHLLKRNGGKAL